MNPFDNSLNGRERVGAVSKLWQEKNGKVKSITLVADQHSKRKRQSKYDQYVDRINNGLAKDMSYKELVEELNVSYAGLVDYIKKHRRE